MALVLTPPRVIPPAGGSARLNRAHPLARGLVSMVTPHQGLKDIVNGRAGTPTALGTALTPKGRAWQFDGNTSLINWGGLPPNLPDLTGTYTMAAWVMANSASPARTVTQVCDGTRNTHICYVPTNSYLGLESAASGSGLSVLVSSGSPCLVIGSATGGTPIDVYVNGVKGQNNGSPGITASTQAGYTIGKRIGGTSFLGPLWMSAVWNRYLTAEEKLQFTRNPWALFESLRLWIDQPIGADSGLSGFAAGQGFATGELTTQIPLSGAAVVQATGNGSLTTQIPLSGSAAAVSVASGVLTTTVQLSGDALAQAGATGELTTQIRLSGAAVMQAIASAELDTSSSGLSGAAVISATATGTLTTGIPLAGHASALVTGAGGLTTQIPLSGAAVAVCNATGELIVSGSLSAAAVAQVIATGTLSTQIRLSAAAVMSALASASLGSPAGMGWIADPRYRASGRYRSYRACHP